MDNTKLLPLYVSLRFVWPNTLCVSSPDDRYALSRDSAGLLMFLPIPSSRAFCLAKQHTAPRYYRFGRRQHKSTIMQKCSSRRYYSKFFFGLMTKIWLPLHSLCSKAKSWMHSSSAKISTARTAWYLSWIIWIRSWYLWTLNSYASFLPVARSAPAHHTIR